MCYFRLKMPRHNDFSKDQMRDMVCVYAQENFCPDRRQPNHQTFEALYDRFGETGSFLSKNVNAGKPRVIGADTEDEILVRVTENPETSSRRIKAATGESAAVQMLLETLIEKEEDTTFPGRQWALQEVRSLVCSYLHQVFIADTMLCKLVHFQGYPSELLEVVIKGVPSMHICLDFLQELMQQPSLKKQIFAIQLLSHLSIQYALPKSLTLCVTALNLLYALLGGISSSQRVKLFKPVLPALVLISEAFPPLINDIVNLLMQLAKICESQASLASHFDSQRTPGLEISAQESADLCDLTQKTFTEIIEKSVLRNAVYRQE